MIFASVYSMSLSIILRTVCGCEKIIAIPGQQYPRHYTVPYIRQRYWHMWSDDDVPRDSGVSTRQFERIGVRGLYGYEVYLEQL